MNLLDIIPDDIKLNIIEFGGHLEFDDVQSIIDRIIFYCNHWDLSLFLRYIEIQNEFKNHKDYDIISNYDSDPQCKELRHMKNLYHSRTLHMFPDEEHSWHIKYIKRGTKYDTLFDPPTITINDIDKDDLCILRYELQNAILDASFRRSIPESIHQFFEFIGNLDVTMNTLPRYNKYFIIKDKLFVSNYNDMITIDFKCYADKEKFIESFKNHSNFTLFTLQFATSREIIINDKIETVEFIEFGKTNDLHVGLYLSPGKFVTQESIRCNEYNILYKSSYDTGYIDDTLRKFRYSLCPIYY